MKKMNEKEMKKANGGFTTYECKNENTKNKHVVYVGALWWKAGRYGIPCVSKFTKCPVCGGASKYCLE